MNLNLHNKKVIVLAGSKGIGFAIAKSLKQEGAQVAIVARDIEQLKASAQELNTPYFYTADLYQSSQTAEVVSKAIQAMGGVDVLVINNGGPPKGSFEKLDEAQWRQGFDGLWLSSVASIQKVLPQMKKQKSGRILLVTSVAAKEPLQGLTVSSTLRAGLLSLTKMLSQEYAPHGITVNAILPGYTATKNLIPYINEETLSKIPMHRFAEPEEQGHLAAFLASDKAAYITGQAIACDGGYLRGI